MNGEQYGTCGTESTPKAPERQKQAIMIETLSHMG